MAKKEKYEELAKQIIDSVGGKDNVEFLTHCITRLRFNLKDKGLVDREKIDKMTGVMGSQYLGEQYQVVIGAEVDKVYKKICEVYDFAVTDTIEENLDEGKYKRHFSVKQIGNEVVSYLSSTMTGIIPVLIAAAMFKTIGSLIGPDVLNLVSAESDIYLLFDMLYDAFFYFLPICLGYSAAKVLKFDALVGIYIGAMIIVPDFVAMIGERETFNVFGLSVPVAAYGQTFLPVILGAWITSLVYKFFKKTIPNILTLWLTPLLTILVMTPIMFAICAPAGSYLGEIISAFLMAMGEAGSGIRIIGSVLLALAYPFLTLFGMHSTAYMAAYVTYFELGYESFLMPMGYIFGWAIFGITLGMLIKFRKKENKSMASSFLISGLLGGITEPALYGLCLKNKKVMKMLLVTCGIGGLISGIINVGVYVPVVGSVFTISALWTGGSTGNIIGGVLLELICFAIGLILILFFTKIDEEKENI